MLTSMCIWRGCFPQLFFQRQTDFFVVAFGMRLAGAVGQMEFPYSSASDVGSQDTWVGAEELSKRRRGVLAKYIPTFKNMHFAFPASPPLNGSFSHYALPLVSSTSWGWGWGRGEKHS